MAFWADEIKRHIQGYKKELGQGLVVGRCREPGREPADVFCPGASSLPFHMLPSNTSGLTHLSWYFFKIISFFLFKKNIFFQRFYLFLGQRETEHERVGAEREGDTESETGSRLWAISPEPDAGLELTDREIAEVGRLTDWPPRRPQPKFSRMDEWA